MERPVLHGPRVTVRPMTEADVDPIVALVQTPEVSEWWPESGDPERLRAGLGPDDDTWAIEADGELIGWLAITEEDDPDYRYASLDISLDPAHIGQGLGAEALRAAIDWLVDARGHHRFTIDPAAGNERAIRAYASIGFKPVGIVRQAERRPDGTWRDALLMDLLANELR
jgi:aminoglycoside 6'-N-acetyltransferase